MDDEKYGIISFGNSHFVLLIKTFQLQDDSNAEVTLEDGANLNPSTNNLVLISDSSKLIEAILWKVALKVFIAQNMIDEIKYI